MLEITSISPQKSYEGGSFFSVYYEDTRLSFQSHGDEVVNWKVNTYTETVTIRKYVTIAKKFFPTQLFGFLINHDILDFHVLNLV